LVAPDAFVVGNHEFDVGWDTLKVRLSEALFPVSCGNVIEAATGNPIGLTSIILERDGVKIGIIGINTRHLSSMVMSEALEGLRVDEPIDLVNRLLDELGPKTDIQIALTHHGVGEDQRLAQGCPRLDLIVGGHQHSRLYEPLVENEVPILQAGGNGMFLGRFRAEVDTAKDRIISYTGELIPVYSDSIRPRDDIAVLVAELDGSISSELDRVIGYLKSPWNRSWDGESNVGNWTTDAMVRLSGRDIAFVNSGGLRRNIPAGPVTLRDIWELHPFGNYLQGFELTGKELQEGVSYCAQRGGDAVQVGGIRFKARSTGEILELTVTGKPVEPETRYSVIANEYFVEHIGRYMGLELGDREIIDLGWIDRELVEKALAEEGTVDAKVDGRIDVIEEPN
jgi:2',3'-cyclic-nucleotide 2'-phosphodiesterase (5'-nucleotidase family)